MRRKDKEVTDRALMDKVLDEAQIIRIAMCDNAGMPYIVPMNFGYVNGQIYMHSAPAGRKIDILRMGTVVAFQTEIMAEVLTGEAACDYSMRYLSVCGTGKIHFVEDAAEMKQGLDSIMHKYQGPVPESYPQAMLERILVLRLEIEEITGKKSKLDGML